MTLCYSFAVSWSIRGGVCAADNVLSKINVICLPQFSFEVAWNGGNNLATETMLKYKNKHYTMLEKKNTSISEVGEIRICS